MAIPWLGVLDLVLGVTDLARTVRGRRAPAPPEQEQLAPGSRTLGHLETRLASVMVAALKEAFDRDTRRLELEREQLDAERRRAERALRLELLRQAADREIARLRLIAGVAVASCLGTLVFTPRLVNAPVGARVVLGAGWLLLLAALASAFAAQQRVAAGLGRIDESFGPREIAGNSIAGTVAPWLVVAGLALIGIAALM